MRCTLHTLPVWMLPSAYFMKFDSRLNKSLDLFSSDPVSLEFGFWDCRSPSYSLVVLPYLRLAKCSFAIEKALFGKKKMVVFGWSIQTVTLWCFSMTVWLVVCVTAALKQQMHLLAWNQSWCFESWCYVWLRMFCVYVAMSLRMPCFVNPPNPFITKDHQRFMTRFQGWENPNSTDCSFSSGY